MGGPIPDSKSTFSFPEILERIGNCQTTEELELYLSVIEDEQTLYSGYHLTIIAYAFKIMKAILA
jgi:hypothetical protein